MSDADWDGLRHRIQGRGETEIRCSSILRFDAQFQRWSWLPLYLWRVTRSGSLIFNDEAAVVILPIRRGHLLPAFATSLRSGDLGYQSHIQSDHINICYNSLADYADSLRQAIITPHANYQRLTEQHGPAAQISPHILQSEAEFYTTVRAKTAAPPGENFLTHLLRQGPTISRYDCSTSILFPTLE